MTSIADGSVHIQTSAESVPSTPSWFGEVVVISRYLQKHNGLNKINGQVRFARKRVGRSEVIDFLAVLFGYAISGQRTLQEFYERLQPFAVPFMAGAGAGSVALPFGALALFSSPDGRTRRNTARALSR